MANVSTAEVGGQYDSADNRRQYRADKLAREIAAFASVGRDGGIFHSGGAVARKTHGYWVGGVEDSLQIVIEDSAKPPTYAEVYYPTRDYLARYLTDDVKFVGFWVNDSEGILYVDITSWHIDRNKAIEAGRLRGELSIWSIVADWGIEL